MHVRKTMVATLAGLALAGCGRPPEEQALADVKAYVQENLDALHAASVALQQAAPAPDADGWSAAADAAAVEKMRGEWKRARRAYEHVEGAIAVLFPELDVATDERYDGFLAEGPDDALFDGEGVTGVHAVERILWADGIPGPVVEFEQGLPGYLPAAFPATAAEAQAFRDGLVARLVADTDTMRAQFAPLALDNASAFRGVIGSMQEQVEKMQLAATGEEESRYAQFTLEDMRANVEGGQRIYAAFRPWLETKQGGAEVDARIQAAFARLTAAYAGVQGEALPPVPSTWSSANPSEADLATPFGRLYVAVASEADGARADSLVSGLLEAAALLGIPQLP